MFDVQFAPRVVEEDLPQLPAEVLDDLLGDPDDPDSRGKVELLRTNPEVGAHLGKQLHGFQRLTLSGRYRCIYKAFVERRLIGIVLVGIRRGAHRTDVYMRARSLIARMSDPSAFESKTDPGSHTWGAPARYPAAKEAWQRMTTSKRVAYVAGKMLENPKSTKKENEVAASDLAQAQHDRRRGRPAKRRK